MSAEHGFNLHPEAGQDIRESWEFIAKDSPLAARRVREEILDAIREVVSFPHQGHRRPDLTSRSLRFRRVRDYLIAYAPDESPLLVVAVLHGRPSPRVMEAISARAYSPAARSRRTFRTRAFNSGKRKGLVR